MAVEVTDEAPTEQISQHIKELQEKLFALNREVDGLSQELGLLNRALKARLTKPSE